MLSPSFRQFGVVLQQRSNTIIFKSFGTASVSRNLGGVYPTCCSRWGAGKNVLRKVQATLRPGTGGRLCSPNLRFWRPALSIELHPYIIAPLLIAATGPGRQEEGMKATPSEGRGKLWERRGCTPPHSHYKGCIWLFYVYFQSNNP